MHPLFSIMANQPQLLLDHAQAYAVLFQQEFDASRKAWRQRVMLQAAAACSLAIAVMLAGVSAMLWAITSSSQIHSPWVLWTIPLMPLGIALVCGVQAHNVTQGKAFANLWRQISADMAMLQAAGAS
jgi:hypothetical protein